MSPSSAVFDEAKYKALTDGLEISEVWYSDIIQSLRYDAEYYAKEYIREEKRLKDSAHFLIKDKYFVTDGEHGSVEYLDNGVKYLTAENIKNGYVDIAKVRYVSEAVDKRNARASVCPGDILISIKGTLGQAAVATEELIPCNMNRDVAIIKPFKQLEVTNYYIATFLMCKYGALQSCRGGSGGVQQMITLGRLREFIVPKFSDNFYKIIKDAYLIFLRLRDQSVAEYTKAEQILEKELSLDVTDLSTDSISIKSFSESFGKTGRMDAEYYQKKMYELIKEIGEYGTIGSLCNIYDKNFNPDVNTKYKYIELADIGNSGEIEDFSYVNGDELPTRARRLVKAGQVIVSSVEGSLESCAIIPAELNNSLCSTGFYVLDSKYYNSETLLVLLKSKPIQMLLKRGCSGTILSAISKEEFFKVPLPEVPHEIQNEIKAKIETVNLLRAKSKAMLNSAVKAVEMAIEKDDTTAAAWLEGQMGTAQ